jgi:hypothetical protein
MPKSKSIQQELNEISQSVADLTENTPYRVPTAYFDNFHTRLLQQIKEQELDPSSSLLSGLKNELPFEIPKDYFSNFRPEIPKENINSGKLIPIGRILRYAVAACTIVAASLWVYQMENTQEAALQGTVVGATFEEKISLDAYNSYLTESAIAEIPDQELEDVEVNGTLLVEINSNTIQEMLQEIPENDISSYLQQDGYDGSGIME